MEVPIVLIVDDNANYRKILATVLAAEGFRPIQAGNGEEAIVLMRLDTPHLVLCDVHMPVMDGIQFLEFVRNDPRYTNIPVVMITNVQEEVDNAVRHGANEGILKSSLTPKEVAQVVRQHLGS